MNLKTCLAGSHKQDKDVPDMIERKRRLACCCALGHTLNCLEALRGVPRMTDRSFSAFRACCLLNVLQLVLLCCKVDVCMISVFAYLELVQSVVRWSVCVSVDTWSLSSKQPGKDLTWASQALFFTWVRHDVNKWVSHHFPTRKPNVIFVSHIVLAVKYKVRKTDCDKCIYKRASTVWAESTARWWKYTAPDELDA